MTDGAELILSKSALAEWLRCRRAYLYAYVYRIKGTPNLDMLTGIATHAGAEAYWKHQPPYDATRAAFVYEGPLDATTTSETVVAALFDALAMTKLYIEKIVPTFTSKPTIIEQDFLIRVDGTLVSGRIDVADEDVHDTKTTSTPSKVTADSHRLGMSIYRHGFKALTGLFPGKLLLDIVAKNGRWKVLEVEPDDQGMAEVVGMVAAGINAGDFEPTGAAKGECARCPYQTICPSARHVDVPAIMEVILE